MVYPDIPNHVQFQNILCHNLEPVCVCFDVLTKLNLNTFGNKINNTKTHLSKSLGDTGLDVVGRSTEGFTTLGHEASSKVS